MQKKLYFLFVFSLLNITCFSQTKSHNEKHLLNKTSISTENKSTRISTSTKIDSLSSTHENKVELKKLSFPSNQKISPEVFYVINDKPVSREEYLKLRKNK